LVHEDVVMGPSSSDATLHHPYPSSGDDAAAVAAANEAALAAAKRHRIQQLLDEALAATFPASDPVAIVTSQREEDWD
jgi:hypothetical protein